MSICFDDSKNAGENDLYLLEWSGHYAAAICQGQKHPPPDLSWSKPTRLFLTQDGRVCPPGGVHL